MRIPRTVREWAPRKGARIGGIPEWYGFTVILVFCAGLLTVSLLLFR
jgi:hypothetical protein